MAFLSLRVSHEHPLSFQLLWKHFSGTDWVLNFSCHCLQELSQCQAQGSQHGIEQLSNTQPGPKPSFQLHLLLFTHCSPTDLSYLSFLVHSLCFSGFCSLKYHSLLDPTISPRENHTLCSPRYFPTDTPSIKKFLTVLNTLTFSVKLKIFMGSKNGSQL